VAQRWSDTNRRKLTTGSSGNTHLNILPAVTLLTNVEQSGDFKTMYVKQVL